MNEETVGVLRAQRSLLHTHKRHPLQIKVTANHVSSLHNDFPERSGEQDRNRPGLRRGGQPWKRGKEKKKKRGWGDERGFGPRVLKQGIKFRLNVALCVSSMSVFHDSKSSRPLSWQKLLICSVPYKSLVRCTSLILNYLSIIKKEMYFSV